MDTGLATPLEVYQGLAAEGYQISYRRVPLSRERTPEAADLDVLHQQLMMQPVGEYEKGLLAGSVLQCRVRETCQCGLPCMLALTWRMHLSPSPCGGAPRVAWSNPCRPAVHMPRCSEAEGNTTSDSTACEHAQQEAPLPEAEASCRACTGQSTCIRSMPP